MVRICSVCKRAESEPTQGLMLSHGILSVKCYYSFYKKDIKSGLLPKITKGMFGINLERL